MIKNYLKIAFRNLQRNKRFAIINIMGLGIAMGACLVIFLVIKHEYSYDTYHKNAANIYQVVKNDVTADGDNFNVGMPFPAIKALRIEYPQVKFANLYYTGSGQVTVLNDSSASMGKKIIEPEGIAYAEPEIFQLFDVNWLSGNEEVLKNDNTVTLSKSSAIKYFGSWESSIGKYISLDNTVTARVAGVFEDVPANTDFPFKVVLSYRSLETHFEKFGFGGLADDWHASWSSNQVYALLPAAVKPETLNNSFKLFVAKYYKDSNIKSNKKIQFLQPLRNIHFDTRFSTNGSHISSKNSLYTLSFIGILILLMACINFINLSTALSVKRNKEVGIRKVLGSSNNQLTAQIMAETLMIVLLATGIALLIAFYSLPYLKYIVQIENTLPLFSTGTIVFLLLAVIVVTILSGTYPALIVSRFQPVEAMKNKINNTQLGGVSLRRLLVVIQFSFSQVLIIATIVALQQMHYVQNADLGFHKEAVLLLHGNNDSTSLARQDAFKEDLLKLAGVESVSFSNDAPSSGNTWGMNFAYDNVATDKDFGTALKFADAEFAKTYGLQMVAGKFYTNDSFPQVVINETLAKRVGVKNPEQAIGKTIRVGGGKWVPIVGVVKDFKNNSLRDEIPPTILLKQKKYYGLTGIKLSTVNLGKMNADIQKIWDAHFPEYAYDSNFLEDSINRFYIQEDRMSALFKVYAFLAIFISCLGLYGLVSFMAVQKTKEVGIRKVLGASLGNIVYLFSKEFTLLIGIAFLIAAPTGYYLMHKWLTSFVFRVDIGISVFITAMFTSIVIAWITVGYKAIRAARANPVKSLRTE
jgi:predicted permease